MCLHEKISKRVLDKDNRCKDYLKNVPHLHKVLEFSFVNRFQDSIVLNKNNRISRHWQSER